MTAVISEKIYRKLRVSHPNVGVFCTCALTLVYDFSDLENVSPIVTLAIPHTLNRDGLQRSTSPSHGGKPCQEYRDADASHGRDIVDIVDRFEKNGEQELCGCER